MSCLPSAHPILLQNTVDVPVASAAALVVLLILAVHGMTTCASYDHAIAVVVVIRLPYLSFHFPTGEGCSSHP